MAAPSPENTLVTVSGASGFIALYCIKELLSRGFSVRGTLRSLNKESEVRRVLAPYISRPDQLSFVRADLMDDIGWTSAVDGARYVLHTASPLPAVPPKHEDDLIVPAREGTVRVLRAAAEAGVSRVVLTSSMAAVFSGRPRTADYTFTEKDWSDLKGTMPAYSRSKTLAERAAWDFLETLPANKAPELATINPVFVLGPGLRDVDNTSNELIAKLLRREVPGVPRLHVGVVDVRDVAAAHVLAMLEPNAAGKRFILTSESIWLREIADTLRAAGYKVPTRVVPNWLVRVVGWFDKSVGLIVHDLDLPFVASRQQAKDVLGWQGRPIKETVLDTAEAIQKRL